MGENPVEVVESIHYLATMMRAFGQASSSDKNWTSRIVPDLYCAKLLLVEVANYSDSACTVCSGKSLPYIYDTCSTVEKK